MDRLKTELQQLKSSNLRLSSTVQELRLEISYYRGETKKLEFEKNELKQEVNKINDMSRKWISELKSQRSSKLIDDSVYFSNLVKFPARPIGDVFSLRNMMVLMTTADPPFFVEYANKAWSLECGWQSEEVVGLTLAFLQGEDTDMDVANTLTRDAMTTGYGYMRINNYRKDGSVFTGTVTVFPMYDTVCAVGSDSDAPILTHFVAILSDVVDVNPTGSDGSRTTVIRGLPSAFPRNKQQQQEREGRRSNPSTAGAGVNAEPLSSSSTAATKQHYSIHAPPAQPLHPYSWASLSISAGSSLSAATGTITREEKERGNPPPRDDTAAYAPLSSPRPAPKRTHERVKSSSASSSAESSAGDSCGSSSKGGIRKQSQKSSSTSREFSDDSVEKSSSGISSIAGFGSLSVLGGCDGKIRGPKRIDQTEQDSECAVSKHETDIMTQNQHNIMASASSSMSLSEAFRGQSKHSTRDKSPSSSSEDNMSLSDVSHSSSQSSSSSYSARSAASNNNNKVKRGRGAACSLQSNTENNNININHGQGAQSSSKDVLMVEYDRRQRAQSFNFQYEITVENYKGLMNGIRLSDLLRMMVSFKLVVMLTDPAGLGLHVSRDWAAQTGYSVVDVEGASWLELQGYHRGSEVATKCEAILRSGRSGELEMMSFRKEEGSDGVGQRCCLLLLPVHGGHNSAAISHYSWLLHSLSA